MKAILMMSLVVMLSVALVNTSSAQAKKGMKEVTVVGEIIDTKCYISGMMGGRGEEHKQCAIDCINGGLPVGVVEDKTDKVYVLVPQKGGTKGANEELVQYAAQTVKLTGNVIEKGGQKLLVYSKVEAVR